MRKVFIVPNLITASSLICGLMAIFQVFDQGDWLLAVHLVFLAAILDTFDGAVARITKTQSAFGANFDSLADTVSFGVAPACIVYTAIAPEAPLIAKVSCAFYTTFTAMRLARFNVQQSKEEKKSFTGLPSPGGAMTALSVFWVFINHPRIESVLPADKALPVVMVALGYLMFSRFPYHGPKSFNIARSHPDEVLVAAVIVLFMIVLLHQHIDLIAAALFVPYALSGPVVYLLQRRRPQESAKGRRARAAEPAALEAPAPEPPSDSAQR